jgi:hypothetical protein
MEMAGGWWAVVQEMQVLSGRQVKDWMRTAHKQQVATGTSPTKKLVYAPPVSLSPNFMFRPRAASPYRQGIRPLVVGIRATIAFDRVQDLSKLMREVPRTPDFARKSC